MATLAKRNADIVILKIDISEPDSPVAKQYNTETIPFFKIFDGQGSLIAEGAAAVEWLDEAMKAAGLSNEPSKD